MRQTLLSIVALAFSVVGVGCKGRPNDDAIAKDVQTKLASDPTTKDAAVNVSAKDGKVKLTGTVPDSSVQQKMEQVARQEPGATGVDDETNLQPSPPPPPPPPQPIIVPVGTVLSVTLAQSLSSKTSQAGQPFHGTVTTSVRVDGKIAIPKGSRVTGRVVSAKAKGKIKGEGELAVSLIDVTVHGADYAIETGTLDSDVKGKGKRTAATTGGGAAGGALIGGLAGGGKGAGIGALVGGAAGLIGGAATGNKQIEIPAESTLTFTLAKALTLPPPGE
jgi:BON domain